MKPTLFVLAAGMGSRYGGLKQLDGLGPHGETIMDYSIYDAIHAGFGKIVFVIRKDFEQDFREKILSKYEGHIPVEVVFQSITDLPEGYTCPEDRTKPWGTNHAVLMGKNAIKEPFAVINADDFYGRNAFEVIAKELSRPQRRLLHGRFPRRQHHDRKRLRGAWRLLDQGRKSGIGRGAHSHQLRQGGPHSIHRRKRHRADS